MRQDESSSWVGRTVEMKIRSWDNKHVSELIDWSL